MGIEDMSQADLRKAATKIVAAKTAESTLFDQEAENRIPRFRASEIESGVFLGEGGFCKVTELLEVFLDGQADASPSPFTQDREYISKNFQRDGRARYAIKKLKPDLFNRGPENFLSGVVDLAIEVKYLALIQHPHIIKMRAVCDVDYCSEKFFVVLDRLFDTLGDRIQVWAKELKSMSGLKSIKDVGGGKKEEHLGQRLVVLYDICSALNFLHSNNIIYRDLKPDNIGFDVRDDVKIFDFGLAAEMRPDLSDGNDGYHLTAESGSPRYMAPEVALGKPYNQRVDTYSFGLLLWEVCEMKTPFEGHDFDSLTAQVYNGNERPPINKKLRQELANIMTTCWDANPSRRMDCEEIMSQLRNEIGISYGTDSIFGQLDETHKTEKSAQAHGR